jgi:hypothetical protein
MPSSVPYRVPPPFTIPSLNSRSRHTTLMPSFWHPSIFISLFSHPSSYPRPLRIRTLQGRSARGQGWSVGGQATATPGSRGGLTEGSTHGVGGLPTGARVMGSRPLRGALGQAGVLALGSLPARGARGQADISTTAQAWRAIFGSSSSPFPNFSCTVS